MKDWNFAAHSHTVKKYGGPEKFITVIRAHERQQVTKAVNKKWIHGAIPALAVLVPLAAKGGYDLVMEYRQKKIVSDAKAQQAEKELIEHFEKHNCTEPEPEEPPCL